MTTHSRITMLIYGMVDAVLFGIGAVLVLSLPGLQEQWKFWLPIVIVAAFILAAPIAWAIAPRLRARYWREHDPDADYFA